ncbi:hypothetical protein BJY52DRAFT_1189103 [Lactarius psammicola]|nr:hypothetical protein BJY52DRAFT_1189103 [Lactarius psammicola]
MTRWAYLCMRFDYTFLPVAATTRRPHIVLGTFAGDDANWASCDLAAPYPPPAFGVHEREQRALFAHLSLLSANMSTRRDMGDVQGGTKVRDMVAHHTLEPPAGVAQADANAVATPRRPAKWQCGRDRVREPTKEGRRGVL